MDTGKANKTCRQNWKRFIILIPHRDTLKPLEQYREKLFATGYYGAFSFPLAAPLFSVSRPFCCEELKELAHNIRLLTMQRDGKILCSGSSITNYHDGEMSFFGPFLDISIEKEILPKTATGKILSVFSPPVICAALVASGEEPFREERPALSFRAASLTNLAIRPLDSGAPGYSFEWRMSPPVWLPKHKG